MPALLDLAIRRDPETGQFDLAVEARDLALDGTAATPMILALGTDRWAKPDDTLPDGTRASAAGSAVGARRGWPGDAVLGGRIGCRLWLLDREKQRETTRLRAIAYAEEGLAPLAARGFAIAVDAAWAGRGLLSLTARASAAGSEIAASAVTITMHAGLGTAA